ncbi:MAG TPA: FAD-dependent oxidoreductase [Candidatus Gastranaerophilaceae bacterium]|nr:FAD-dependent oxidoreductase [Candidatus Gastranaerophilaceae bacterium]HPT40925.1 FAD-dependent oxidoreductase [Candidatus Gastranaerophilaceae bacterium]
MKILIVGGGAAGASCAARLRRLREDAQITILEKTGEISIANCGLPYFCSDVISDRDKMLVSNPTVFKELLNIDVRLHSEVTLINRLNKSVKINNDYEMSYDKLVLALGANSIKPPIEGINAQNIFTVRMLEDADKIKEYVSKNEVKNTVVIGGGFIGVEMAENLAHLGIKTSLVELADQILAPLDAEIAAFAQNQMRDNGVELILSDGVKTFEQKEIELNSGKKIPYDLAILAIGVRPEISLARECGLDIGQTGGILVNEFMQTSDENIYAAGDSVEIIDFVTNSKALIPLAGPANRQGRIIADNIAGLNSTYKNSQGTAVVKVFDLTAASVGNNEKQLLKKEIEYKKVYIWGNSHAGYYPGSFPLMIKLLFSPEGKIFGAQAVGFDMVEKRIDVISSVMRFGGKVQDLIDSELCYAPPYSSAKDLVNIVGMAADNILKKLSKPAFYEDLQDAFIVDVRPEISFKVKTIEGAVNIPVTQLRWRMGEIPKDKKVVLFCDKGFNSYVAARILIQNGFENVLNLSGGFLLYKEIAKDKKGIVALNSNPNTTTLGSVLTLDACGLQCPGPILKLSEAIKELKEGEIIEVLTTDSGFALDIEGWCETTGNTLLNVSRENKMIKASIKKGEGKVMIQQTKDGQTIVVFSNDLDKVLASFIIANGAVASGKKVSMFFTFWGLNVLRKSGNVKIKKNFIEKMFSFMMPKGAQKLILSQMNMGGLGTLMMKWVMKSKNVFSLPELIKTAQQSGVKFIACTMSMDVMGIKEEELIDGVELGGVAKYIAETNSANSNLFI